MDLIEEAPLKLAVARPRAPAKGENLLPPLGFLLF